MNASLLVQPTELKKTTRMLGNYHSIMAEIISKINAEFANYKYTVYRCACKFVSLQNALYTAQIPYKLVLAVIHHIDETNINLMIPPFQLTSILKDIYFASEKLGLFNKCQEYNLEIATTMLSHFFWSTFDPYRCHSISILEIKASLLLLCKWTSKGELIDEFYKLIYNKNSKCVPKLHFEYLVIIFAKIFTFIEEGKAYGIQNLEKLVLQCFSAVHNSMGLTEQQFHKLWTVTQTRFLIYANLVVTIKRLEFTKNFIHGMSCSSCIEKIVGIRFKCRTCRNLSLCLKCFARGYATNKHQSGHRVYEILNEDLPRKKISNFFAKYCNVFCTRTPSNDEADEIKEFRNNIQGNVPNETELVTEAKNKTAICQSTKILRTPIRSDTNDQSSPEINLNKVAPSIVGLSATASNASNISVRLQSIIDRVLIQNFKIEQYLKFVPTATSEQISEFLRSHQLFLMDIIKDMRNFKKLSNALATSYPTSSTPNHSAYLNKAVILDNSSLSMAKSNLTRSINGADINRSYLEANKSDFSLNDVSVWFNQQKMQRPYLDVLKESQTHMSLSSETELSNFRVLLHKVKEIVEDSYSDNIELAAATQNLENVLDCIIKCEET